MNLYFVYNGYQGYSPVYVEAIAASTERARELASEQFRKDGQPNGRYFGGHDESYWTNLSVVFKYKLADEYEEYVSEVLD